MSLKRNGVPKYDERFLDNIERHLTSFHTIKNIRLVAKAENVLHQIHVHILYCYIFLDAYVNMRMLTSSAD